MDRNVAVLGLGYVGLPLALALASSGREVVGFDVNPALIASLRQGLDPNGEVGAVSISDSSVRFTFDPSDLAGAEVFIIAVPTPLKNRSHPDLEPVCSACDAIAPHLRRGALVVLESTVYPGVTEEICAPRLAGLSGLRAFADFALGYSPERVNPGNAEHSISSVVKIVAGQDPETLERVAAIYQPIAKAGLHRAPTIKTAEAAKVIENTQRDINIALVNEFALIFARLGIDTTEVLEAAGTKWNFLPFRPGLVGGHCIGVDPFYLTFKAESVGYHPEVILAGRRINDRMGQHVALEVIKRMLEKGIELRKARVLVLGFTFKENCADIRNTKVFDIVCELKSFFVGVDVYDPQTSSEKVQAEYGIALLSAPAKGAYDAVILTVAHRDFLEIGVKEIKAYGNADSVFYDVKSVFPKQASDGRL